MDKYGVLFVYSFIVIPGLQIYYVSTKELHVSKATYYLRQDCQDPGNRDRFYTGQNPNKRLNVDLSTHSTVDIFSHSGMDSRTPDPTRAHLYSSSTSKEDQNTEYPNDLACEIIAHAGDGQRIMLQIDKLFIPSPVAICDDNYLYVFDSNTPRYRAMPEAGGEKGLCQKDQPKRPIFTSKSYITIVFKSTLKSPVEGEPGLKLTLTAIKDAKDSVCPASSFMCPSMDLSLLTMGFDDSSSSTSSRKRRSAAGKETRNQDVEGEAKVSASASTASALTSPVFCIPESLKCDGVKHCPDGGDEDSKTAGCGENNKNLFSRFLSLGVSASIAIAVGSIVCVTICVGVTLCFCCRCCSKTAHTGDNKPLPPGIQSSPAHYLIPSMDSDVNTSGVAWNSGTPMRTNHYRVVNQDAESPFLYKKGSPHTSQISGSGGYQPLVHPSRQQTNSFVSSRVSSCPYSQYPQAASLTGTPSQCSYPSSAPASHHNHPSYAMEGHSPHQGRVMRESYHSAPPAHNHHHHHPHHPHQGQPPLAGGYPRSRTPTSSRSNKSARSTFCVPPGTSYHHNVFGATQHYTHPNDRHNSTSSNGQTERIQFPVQL